MHDKTLPKYWALNPSDALARSQCHSHNAMLIFKVLESNVNKPANGNSGHVNLAQKAAAKNAGQRRHTSPCGSPPCMYSVHVLCIAARLAAHIAVELLRSRARTCIRRYVNSRNIGAVSGQSRAVLKQATP
mgnify:CR=1 FL=1